MGEDGHTASLFPGSLALARGLDPARRPACIAVNALTAPHARVSLNLAALLDARRIVLHIEGESKWQVYQRARSAGAGGRVAGARGAAAEGSARRRVLVAMSPQQ